MAEILIRNASHFCICTSRNACLRAPFSLYISCIGSVDVFTYLSIIPPAAGHISEILKLDSEVKEIAKEIYKEKSLLVMGRGFNFATCLEGALKIKVRYTEEGSIGQSAPVSASLY